MKALDYLYAIKNGIEQLGQDATHIDEVIKELEYIKNENKELKEYYWVARNHLETYRCKCGSLGRVGYLCSNKDCENE